MDNSKSVIYLNRINDELALNDAAISRALGVGRQTISNVRSRNGEFSDQICIKIADLLGLERMLVIADIRRGGEPSQVSEFWELVYQDFLAREPRS